MRRRYKLLLVTSVVLTSFGLVGLAATKTIQNAQQPTSTRNETPGQAGLVVSIDPETGQLGMPKVPLSQLESDALDTSDDGLKEIHHPSGAVGIDLQGRFQSMSIATIDENGNVQHTCVDSPNQAENALNGENQQQLEER